MQNIGKFLKVLFVILALFNIGNIAHAEDPATVNLTIRDGGTVVFSGTIPLQPAGTVSLTDIDGIAHDVNANSVLAIIHDADISSDNFTVSNLTYFASFGSLYIKCITDASGESCDNWQYVVNNSYPFVGMDQNILSGGETIYVYFGPQNKIVLSSSNINTSDTLTVTTQAYDYENDSWVARTGVTVGLTQPNPSDPFSPTEVTTTTVNETGEAIFTSIIEGTYNVGVKEDFYFPTEPLTVNALPPPTPHSGGGGSGNKKSGVVLGATTKIKFDINKAFDFLSLHQEENGSFGEDMYTDWATIAFASSPFYKTETIKLIKYFGESKQAGTLLTDDERHAMALMTLGLNPYHTNGINYIDNIVSKFDGKQFGDIVEDNDDIFALIVLENAGFKVEDTIITNDIAFVLSKQKENGSWDESIDMTGAAIVALSSFNQNEKVKVALEKARGFLKENQKKEGGWGNVSSTTWAMGGILALGEKPEEWIKNENTPVDYLALNQDTDGGIKNENIKNKIWETAYVLTALSGKTWNQIMQKFEKQNIEIALTTQVTKTEVKTFAKTRTLKNNTQKLENIASENIATAIAPAVDTPTESESTKKRSWVGRLLDNIVGIFF